jgi:hypothetical protein
LLYCYCRCNLLLQSSSWNKGIQGKMFRVLAQMTDSPTSMVLHQGAWSAPFHPDMGWEQGDTLATTMFNIHVDAVLHDVWAHHAGVPVPVSSTSNTAGKLVALMYADDMVGLADGPTSLQALVDRTRLALTKWRLKASVKPTYGSKTTVLVVRGASKTARRRATNADGGPRVHTAPTWGNVSIPQVRSYRYLGVWISDVGNWDEHLSIRQQKADAAASAHRGIMQNCKLPWHVRKTIMVSVVQPVLTFACQVWSNTSVALRKRLDSWQLTHVKRMCHCPPTASGECVRREMGVLPLHMACDIWQLTYWHELRGMSSDRLVHQVFSAWFGPANPWQANINRLLVEYGVDADATATLSKSKFVSLLKDKVVDVLSRLDAAPGVRGRQHIGAMLSSYDECYGAGLIKFQKPAARSYVTTLSNMGRGLAAELCMRLRVQCLQLHAMHTHERRNESTGARHARMQCPCCQHAAETPYHFLLECHAYAALRDPMLRALQSIKPQRAEAIQSETPERAWRLLLADDILGAGPRIRRPFAAGQHHMQMQQLQQHELTLMELVAGYVIGAWQLRSAVLAGRGTNGGNPMV